MRLRYCKRNELYYVWDPDNPNLEFDENDKAVPTMNFLAGDGKTLNEAVGEAVRTLIVADDNGILIEDIEELKELPLKQPVMDGVLSEASVPFTTAKKPSIESYIPAGYEFVKMGRGKEGEQYVTHSGDVETLQRDDHSRCRIIVQRIQHRWKVTRDETLWSVIIAEDPVQAASLYEIASSKVRVFNVCRSHEKIHEDGQTVDLGKLNYPSPFDVKGDRP